MGSPFVGEIRMFGGNFAPAGWMFCQGQTLPISQNETLFNLIGTTYGGDGQETFNVPNLTGRGALRVKVESVKVKAARRSGGIGARMIAFAEGYAREQGARAMELTSNKTRKDAHRFYERLGFARSHEGFKKKL